MEKKLQKLTQVPYQIVASLKDLPVSVSAIWGGRDAWIPLTETHRLSALLPSLDLRVISDAGHMPMESHAACFNEHLLSLLKA